MKLFCELVLAVPAVWDDIDAFNLVHATSFAEYEGYATWAIGVAYESEFTVGTLSDPARLIIDICH